jgi:hypothetical protein
MEKERPINFFNREREREREREINLYELNEKRKEM